MSFTPSNDLDRALIAAYESPANVAEFYRQLGEGELFLLIPYHPEFKDQKFKLENGQPFPFIMQPDAQGEVVLLFSSEERAQEGLRKGKVPPHKYWIVSMEAKQALEVIGKMGMRALLNKSCSTPQFTLPPNLMVDIASGDVFRTEGLGETVEKTLNILAPENYPTALLEPLCQAMRRHRNFRAAWVFTDAATAAQAPRGRSFQIMVLMDPRDLAMFHELDLVIGAAKSKDDIVDRGLIDEDDAVYVSQLFGAAEPFYLAEDFARARKPEDR